MTEIEEEIIEIKKIIQFYIDAVVNFDLNLVEKAWHEKGKKYIIDSTGKEILFQDSPVIEAREMETKPNPNIKQQCLIESVEIAGTAAIGKIKWIVEGPDFKLQEINFLSLLKDKNGWIIISKVSDRKRI